LQMVHDGSPWVVGETPTACTAVNPCWARMRK
jgi:hypothetical protein